jgi:hypothetical protein
MEISSKKPSYETFFEETNKNAKTGCNKNLSVLLTSTLIVQLMIGTGLVTYSSAIAGAGMIRSIII